MLAIEVLDSLHGGGEATTRVMGVLEAYEGGLAVGVGRVYLDEN